MQCPDCTTFHFLWCLRIASFGAVTGADIFINLTFKNLFNFHAIFKAV